MKPQYSLGRITTPDGREFLLHERDGVYSIRVDGRELMTSRCHGSEEALARLVLARLSSRRGPKVLVGGLGMGYTLRAVLDHRPAVSLVVVAEIFPAVVQWNRNQLAHLARSPLDDRRVELYEGDVSNLISTSTQAFDAVLLDVDNGPSAFTVDHNAALYRPHGLAAVYRSLRAAGILGVWSSDPDPAFVRRLRKARFRVETEAVTARGGAKGPQHTIFIAGKRG